ncbi:MAG: IS66 family transposase [Bacteroidota bacterium]
MIRKTPAETRPILKAYANYSSTKKEFCQEHGIKLHVLSYWLQKSRKTKKPKKSKTHRGYLWGFLAVKEKLLFFDYSPNKKADNPAKHLKEFNGVMQTDCYEIYDQIRKAYPDLTHYHCLTHARREFEKALGNDEKRATYALEQFQLLYQIEAQAREENWSPQQIQRVRNERASSILENLLTWMETESPKLPPKSPIGKAMGYMLKRKSRMLHYLTDGTLSIDTNALENQIRPIAVGRKNYLFCGSHEGARRAAIFYSLFACCKMNEVNPTEWLLDVMRRLPTHSINQLEELLPHLWKPY